MIERGQTREVPPSMRPMGPKGIYRLFGSARHIGGIYTCMVLPD